jgi:hypothetical protein
MPVGLSANKSYTDEKLNRSYESRLAVTVLGLRLDRSTALYIYKAKTCKLLVLFTYAEKTNFIFK